MAKRRSGANDRQGKALMGLIHRVTATHSERPTLGLNVRQRLIIQRLGLEGELHMAALGQQLGLTPSAMTGLVDRLVAQGFVSRLPHPSDRRATLVSLSRKGETAFLREVDFYRVLVDETLAAMGDGARRQVLDALTELGRNAAAVDAA